MLTPSGLYIPGNLHMKKVAKVGKLAAWANNGIICLSIELQNGKEDFQQKSIEEMQARCKDLHAGVVEARREGRYGDEERMMEKFLDAMHDVIKEAEQQGPPSSASCTRDKIRRRKTSALIVTPFVPGKDS